MTSNISNHHHEMITTNEVKNEHNNEEDDDEMGGDFNNDCDADDILNIYDCPKVPPIPVVVLMNSNDQKHSESKLPNKKVQFFREGEKQHQRLK